MNSTFTFTGYTLDKHAGEVRFLYTLQAEQKTYHFSEILSFSAHAIDWTHIPDHVLKNTLDNLLLIIGISYWKTYCSTTIQTPTIQLSKKQAEFWNTVYTKGLGEFFYTNAINYRGLINFPYTQEPLAQSKSLENFSSSQNSSRSLLFFGGGKDSIVSAELLKSQKEPFTLFMVGTSDIQIHTAKRIDVKQIIFERKIDPQLLELNTQPGVYNGHIPISAVWAFLGIFAAVLYNYQYLIVSNEHSASYGNVDYLGQEINHQWSKSLEFENLFREYITENISPHISYFSLLRPLHELEIMKLFVDYPQYFPYFSSCNRNFRIGKRAESEKNWCGECPKCIFVFILLSAFLPKNSVIEIFGKNILDDPLLLSTIKELLGFQAFKPFECVGTPEETQLAFYYIYEKKEFSDTFAMRFFVQEVLPKMNKELLEKEVLKKSTTSNIPGEFQNIFDN